MKFSSENRAFTLIELLVVISIIALFASIAFAKGQELRKQQSNLI
jgi:prepilin-type N-terminal cleavage/methylation domain-containing protein